MSLLGVGSNPDQVAGVGLFGSAAFVDVQDFIARFPPVTTLEVLRASTNTPAKIVFLTDPTIRGLFFRDDTDTTSADDGKDCVLTSDTVQIRFKRRELIRRYTPTSSTDTNIALGEICYDDTRFYVRTASNAVKYITFSGIL